MFQTSEIGTVWGPRLLGIGRPMIQLHYSDKSKGIAETVLQHIVTVANEVLGSKIQRSIFARMDIPKKTLAIAIVRDYLAVVVSLLTVQTEKLIITCSNLHCVARPVAEPSVPPTKELRCTFASTLLSGAIGSSHSYLVTIIKYHRRWEWMMDAAFAPTKRVAALDMERLWLSSSAT